MIRALLAVFILGWLALAFVACAPRPVVMFDNSQCDYLRCLEILAHK